MNKIKNIPLVSIIIPTYNADIHIKKCLDSIKKQNYKNIETIIVDQSSTDNTTNIANQYSVKLITLPKPKFYSPPSKSRNIGAKKAKGKFLYNIDVDMILPENLISSLVNQLKDQSNTGALIIHEQDLTNGFWSEVKALERKCYWNNHNIESARFSKKSIFEKINGYDEKISSGEDFDIEKRFEQITNVGFAKKPIFHNLGKLKLFSLINKKYQYGKTANHYFSKHKTSGQKLLICQFKCYVKNWRLLIKHPILGVNVFFLKLLEFCGGGIGLLINYIYHE